MKEYFKKALLFLCFAFLSYIVLIIVWANIPYSYIGSNFLYRQGSYGHLNTRLKEIPDYGEVDILFVGTSRVYRGFDPRIFEKNGYKIFVLGSSSQTPLQSYVLLKRYLKKLNPDLVVFDVLPNAFAINGIEPSLDVLANDKIDFLSWKMAWEQNDLLVWNTLIYSSISQVFGFHNNFNERKNKPESKDTYISGGYVMKELDNNEKVICDSLDTRKWKTPLPIQIEYFKKSLELCSKYNSDVALINLPLAHYNCYKNNDIIDSIISSNKKVLNYNKLLRFESENDFYNNFHLNKNGVKKLNDFFIKNLK
jgi:hypothetical protein